MRSPEPAERLAAALLIPRTLAKLLHELRDFDLGELLDDEARSGMSVTKVAKKHGISRASVCRLMKEAQRDSDVPALAESVPEHASAAGTAQ